MLITRKQAKSENLKTYFTGKPCKYGHISERRTGNGVCLVCYSPEVMRQRSRAYTRENVDKLRESNREYRSNNRAWHREQMRKHHDKNKNDPLYKSNRALRSLLNRVVKSVGGSNINNGTEAALGYTFEQFRQHIEAQFADWMHWGNHGEWHVDHIKPVAAFISEGVTDPRVINALDNLQPLAASENLRKGARW